MQQFAIPVITRELELLHFALAKEKGFDVSDYIINEALDSTHNWWNKSSNTQTLAENSDPVAIVMTGNFDLWALSSTF